MIEEDNLSDNLNESENNINDKESSSSDFKLSDKDIDKKNPIKLKK
jgi:hypothetical protein